MSKWENALSFLSVLLYLPLAAVAGVAAGIWTDASGGKVVAGCVSLVGLTLILCLNYTDNGRVDDVLIASGITSASVPLWALLDGLWLPWAPSIVLAAILPVAPIAYDSIRELGWQATLLDSVLSWAARLATCCAAYGFVAVTVWLIDGQWRLGLVWSCIPFAVAQLLLAGWFIFKAGQGGADERFHRFIPTMAWLSVVPLFVFFAAGLQMTEAAFTVLGMSSALFVFGLAWCVAKGTDTSRRQKIVRNKGRKVTAIRSL